MLLRVAQFLETFAPHGVWVLGAYEGVDPRNVNPSARKLILLMLESRALCKAKIECFETCLFRSARFKIMNFGSSFLLM